MRIPYFGLQTTPSGEDYYPIQRWIFVGIFGVAVPLLFVAMALSGHGDSLPDFLLWSLRIVLALVILGLLGRVIWDRTYQPCDQPTPISLALVVGAICLVAIVLSLLL